MTDDELERICQEEVLAKQRYYLDICLEGLRKTTNILSEDIRCPREIQTDVISVHLVAALVMYCGLSVGPPTASAV
jgi:hypothetical protein